MLRGSFPPFLFSPGAAARQAIGCRLKADLPTPFFSHLSPSVFRLQPAPPNLDSIVHINANFPQDTFGILGHEPQDLAWGAAVRLLPPLFALVRTE